MLRALLIVFLSSFMISCSSDKKLKCADFKIGKFISHVAEDEYIILDRTDSFQTETNETTGHVFKAKIKWTSSCENELSDIVEKKSFNDTFQLVWPGKILKTKILSVGKNYCVYESTVPGVSMIMRDTLRVYPKTDIPK